MGISDWNENEQTPTSVLNKADEIEQQAYGKPASTEPAVPTPEPAAPQEPVDATPSQDGAEDSVAPTPVDPPLTPTPATPKPEDSEPDAVEQLKQDYNRLLMQHQTLKGKFQSEDKARAEANALRRERDQLKQQIDALQRQQATAPQPTQTVQPSTGIDARQIYDPATYAKLSEELGEDVLNAMVNGVVGHVSRQMVPQLEQTFDHKLKGAVSPITEQFRDAEQRRFMSSLKAVVGNDFDEISRDNAFNEWLTQPITGYTTTTRLDALADAENHGDVGRAVQVFDEWRKRYRPQSAATRTPVQATPLDQQIVPGGSSSATPRTNQPAPDLKVYTGRQIAAMQREVQSLSDSDPRRKQLEDLIDRATADGRIVPG